MCTGCSQDLPIQLEATLKLDASFKKKVEIFERLERKQKEQREKQENTEIQIQIDGGIVTGTSWVTTPLDVLSKEQKKQALVAVVDGALWDLRRPFEGSCSLEWRDFSSEEGQAVFWHSAAHVLGEACQDIYHANLSNGPSIESGFYYDMRKDETVTPSDYLLVEERMLHIIKKKAPFRRVTASREELFELFADNPYKLHFIREKIANNGTIYCSGGFVDFCAGPHIPHTGYIGALKILKNSSAYFLGDAKNDSLQRIYGVAFPTKAQLKVHLEELQEAEKRNHIRLGKSLDLFFFNNMSPGSCFFMPKGTKIYNRLLDFLRTEYRSRGFEEVITPNIFNSALWVQSGHWQNYQENMFQFKLENEIYAMKPMNCPGHCLMFKSKERSYKELPVRYADFGVLHRNELSGALSGLTRVRRFQQDDGHIFCAKESIKSEIAGALDFLKFVYGKFGFSLEYRLGTRPLKFLGELEDWAAAEAQLTAALNDAGVVWELNPEDGAFYGPKIDITILDAYKRKHQTATIQLDFQLPIRFGLEYTVPVEGTNEVSRKRPIIIHRAILGSVERFLAILLEATGGHLPFWLSPRQIMVIPVSKATSEYATGLQQKFYQHGFECAVDNSPLTLNKKIRNAETEKHSFIVVVGEKEASQNLVNIRKGRSCSEDTILSVEDALLLFSEKSSP